MFNKIYCGFTVMAIASSVSWKNASLGFVGPQDVWYDL